jgi:hypothetical protein
MRLLSRSTIPPDRRAARLAALSAASAGRPAAVLSSRTGGLDALAGVIVAYGADRLVGRGDAREGDRALRAAARRLVAEARVRDPQRAECLLVELKRAWPALPGVREIPFPAERRALWDVVVRVVCEEFYAPVAAARRATVTAA